MVMNGKRIDSGGCERESSYYNFPYSVSHYTGYLLFFRLFACKKYLQSVNINNGICLERR